MQVLSGNPLLQKNSPQCGCGEAPAKTKTLKTCKALKTKALALKKSKGQHDDRDAWLRRVALDGHELQFAPDHLRGDCEVVMTAVARSGNALQFAADHLTGDREVVMTAVAENPYALQHATEECRGDKEIMQAALARASADGSRPIGLKARLNPTCLLTKFHVCVKGGGRPEQRLVHFRRMCCDFVKRQPGTGVKRACHSSLSAQIRKRSLARESVLAGLLR